MNLTKNELKMLEQLITYRLYYAAKNPKTSDEVLNTLRSLAVKIGGQIEPKPVREG